MPSIAFPDPTQIGTQRIALDGSNVTVKLGGVRLDKMVSKVSYGVTVEGKEHQYALGERVPFAKTAGNIKPGEIELEFFADKTNEAAALISAAGLFFNDPVDISIVADAGSSAGLAALAQSLAGNTRSIVAKSCDLIGISGSWETGGAALKEPLKFLPLEYLFNGKRGVGGLFSS